MDINEFKRIGTKNKGIHIRVTDADKMWLKKNQVSPTKVFDKILAELKKSNKQR